MPIPFEVADGETLVRCVCSPYHCSKGRLLWQAFQPPRGRDEVSVIRGDFVSPDLCKSTGKALADPANRKVYEGLATIATGAVRLCGADVVDSRVVFLGHADIKHGYQAVDNEPGPAHLIAAIRERCKAMLVHARFITDPNCESDTWNGPLLVASADWATG
jgi:hypothetical protein